MTARVIIIAGPSGVGKSHFASSLGIPVVLLDDFYKDGTDPTLPLIPAGSRNAGMVDWDHPLSLQQAEALRAVASLCRYGFAQVPYYNIEKDARAGEHTVTLGGAPLFVAEGVFSQDLARTLREAGLLAGAFCLTAGPTRTFVRRLWRDLTQRRKPVGFVLGRGLALRRTHIDVIQHAVRQGCAAASPHQARRAIRPMIGSALWPQRPGRVR